MKIIDEDIIRQHPVSDAYRDGWERTFGNPDAESETKDGDAIDVILTMPVQNAVVDLRGCICISCGKVRSPDPRSMSGLCSECYDE